MASPALFHADPTELYRNDTYENDPEPTTAFETVEEIGLLRLRHYAPLEKASGQLPVLLVYSLFKRPFILDLDEQRSVVRCFLDRGIDVYLVDWRPPGAADAHCGIGAYIDDLAQAVTCVCERERIRHVSIVGICFGGLLSLIYAALNPDSVAHVVPVAVGIERQNLVPPVVIEQITLLNGNVPAWWIRGAVNARVPMRALLPQYFAEELDEPKFAKMDDTRKRLYRKLEQWIYSDMPFAGQLARDIMRDIYWDGQLATGQLQVGDRHVALDQIRCPVLNVSGARDQLVPPKNTARLINCVSSSYARNLVFPTGHIGLMASRAAHDDLWPRMCVWLKIID